MTYELGVDLGTTFTAAAVRRGDRVDIAPLGTRGPVIPSVVWLGEDDTVLVGEAAQRRAVTEPTRVAREFKRRIGDTLPIIVGGTPRSAESLSALLLAAVVDEVTRLEGGAPERVALTHPANWGAYKLDLYAQAVRLADLPEVVFLTEPEAAAVHYAAQERVEDGSVVAVYDLGGGTFDATVLRKVGEGFEVLGQPEGIERLGGIDFDQAVLDHVLRSLDIDLESLDRSDPTVLTGVARLRQDCVDAKEALSADNDVSIPVALPGLHTEVRLTRPELEAMLRRPIADTVASLRRALRDADVAESALSTVLLVGGSSRIPMVGEMLGSELGRPVAVDAHPKYAVALGAARFAGIARRADTGSTVPDESDPTTPPTPAPPRAEATVVPAANTPPREPAPPSVTSPPVASGPPSAAAPPDTPPPPEADAELAAVAPLRPKPADAERPAAAPASGGRGGLPVRWLAAAAVVLVALVGGVIALAGGGGGDGGDGGGDAVGGCPDDGPFICLTSASASDGRLRAGFRTVGLTLGPTSTASFFLEAAPDQVVPWDSPDPFVASAGSVPTDARLCALLNDSGGSPQAGTGNCVSLE